MRRVVTSLAIVIAVSINSSAQDQSSKSSTGVESSRAWQDGPLADEDFFPLAVWLQSPRNAPKYKQAGINTYVGLYRGPTESQLAELERNGMRVVCAQNRFGLSEKESATIIAWMHGDEPDNAQRRRNSGGYGPPVPPQEIIEDYQRLKAADPTRPILLNLGQGVAWDGYRGRGVRTNHPEDYAK